MAVVKLTDRYIKNLKPAARDYEVNGGEGLYVRVRKNGTITWIYRFYFGKPCRMTLGTYPGMSLKDARAAHKAAALVRNDGVNPAEQKQEQARSSAAEFRVNDLITEYMERWAKPNKKSWRADQRIFDVDVVPVIGKRRVSDIKRRDLVLLLEAIADRGSPNQSWQTLKVLRRMFNFAVERDILEYSPCTHIKPMAKMQSKNRWLTEAEIRWFWHIIDTTKMSPSVKRCLRMILLTGQRPGEVLQMQWGEIDGRWWTIPPERSKNGRENRVYLTPPARKLIPWNLDGLPFPSSRSGNMQETNVLGKALRRLFKLYNQKQAAAGLPTVEPFTPHDLRHTAATHMAHMGISEFDIGKVLNHTNQSITGVYNHYAYDKEKRRALVMWARRLTQIIRV